MVASERSLPMRQQQMVDVLRDASSLGEVCTSPHLARLMFVRHGVGRPLVYDILGALRRKGVVDIEGDQWTLALAMRTERQA